MKTFIKTIRTITAVLMIIAGLLALFTIDNAQDITTLIGFVMVMVIGVVGGIAILVTTYPELTDLSEFDDKSLKSLEDCQVELDILREHNILLLTRYMTFKSIIISSNVVNEKNKENYPNLYHLLYEEDLVCGKNTIKESSLEQVERFKEGYN